MIKVGDGNTLDGGHVFLFAGKTVATEHSTGGSISIRSGYSLLRSISSLPHRPSLHKLSLNQQFFLP